MEAQEQEHLHNRKDCSQREHWKTNFVSGLWKTFPKQKSTYSTPWKSQIEHSKGGA